MTAPALHVVGSVVLDLVRSVTDDHLRNVSLGGVCFNAAIAARRETRPVHFISTSYRGEIHPIAEVLFDRLGIDWHPQKAVAPIPIFEALVSSDSQVEERFEGTLAYELIDVDAVIADSIPSDVLLTCNDLALGQLSPLISAFEHSFILSTSLEAAPLLAHLPCRPRYLSLNRSELEVAIGRRLTSLADIARASQALVSNQGYALVTLGEAGALLSSAETNAYVYQPTLSAAIREDHWIGAGDALFGAFAGAIVQGVDPTLALARGVASATSSANRLSSVHEDNEIDLLVERLRERASTWIGLT